MDGNLRQIFRDYLPQVHWQSIETGMTGRGVPDSNGCYKGHEFWIEFKTTSHWTVDLRPEQIGWILQRTRAGGNVFIAVRRRCTTTSRRTAADELWLFQGKTARELKDAGLRGPTSPLGFWSGGPRLWAWPEALAALTGDPAVPKRPPAAYG